MSKDSTLYVGSFEINSSKDEMYHFANGYIDIEQGHVKAYCYYVKDHLGKSKGLILYKYADTDSIKGDVYTFYKRLPYQEPKSKGFWNLLFGE